MRRYVMLMLSAIVGVMCLTDGVVQAEFIDVIQLSDTTHVCNLTVPNCEDSYDGDFDTFCQMVRSGSDGTFGGEFYCEHTFAQPCDVDSITYKIRSYASTSGENTRWREVNLSVAYTTGGGDWTHVPGSFISDSGGGTGTTDLNSGVVALSDLNLIGVTGIRLRGNAMATATGGEGSATAFVQLYELQAMGVPEPSTYILIVSGLLVLVARRKMRRG